MVKKERGYTRKEAASIVDQPARRIQFYTDSGLLTPEIANPTGRGTTRRYSRKNLLQLLVLKEMGKFGVPLPVCKVVMESLTLYEGDIWNMDGTPIQRQALRMVLFGYSRFVGTEKTPDPSRPGFGILWVRGTEYEVQFSMGGNGIALVLDINNLIKLLPVD